MIACQIAKIDHCAATATATITNDIQLDTKTITKQVPSKRSFLWVPLRAREGGGPGGLGDQVDWVKWVDFVDWVTRSQC